MIEYAVRFMRIERFRCADTCEVPSERMRVKFAAASASRKAVDQSFAGAWAALGDILRAATYNLES